MCYSVVSMVSQGTEHTAPSPSTFVQGTPNGLGGSTVHGSSPIPSANGYSSYNGSPENSPESSPCDYQYYDTEFAGKLDNLSCHMSQMQNGYKSESPSAYSPAGSYAYSPSYPPQFSNPESCESIQVSGNPSLYNNDPNGYGQVQGSNFSFFNYPQSIEGVCFSAQGPVIQQQICKICGDSASGNHFGVLSCEACKSFFRRSIRANTRYACRGNRNCIVQKHTRNRCQFCRLQKCLVNGMRKEAVQDERKPHSSNSSTLPCSQPATIMSPLPSMSSSSRIYNSLPNLKIESITSPPLTPPTPDSSIMALVDTDGELVPTKRVEIIQMDDLISAMCSSFTSVSEWAKRVPAFVSLSLDDQVKLLKSSWYEHCTLKLAAQNGPKAKSVLLANGMSCNKDLIQDTEVLHFVERVSNEVGYWLDFLNVDKTELACLKGIVLFNPDAKGLSPLSKKCVGFIQEQILQSLETHTKTMYPVSPQRFSKLLLRLAPLKAISLEVVQHMEVQKALGNNTKKDDLLVDFE